MRRLKMVFAAVACAMLIVPGAAWAQGGDDQGYYNDNDREDYEAADNYSLGLGLGLVDPDGDTEPYYTAALRIRLGAHDRSHEDLAGGGLQAFVEPEIGYWQHDSDNSDLLAGVNLIGVVATRRVDYTFGVGAGIHFRDFTVTTFDSNSVQHISTESDQNVGLNGQFGLDVPVGENVAVYGISRFDLVEGTQDDIQEKLLLGLRFNF